MKSGGKGVCQTLQLAQRAASEGPRWTRAIESSTDALPVFVTQQLGRRKKEGPGLVLTCSRNPHDKTVVVRRAQMVTKPGHRVNTIQGRIVKKSLGLRSQSWQGTYPAS